jgi:hypothetical protein
MHATWWHEFIESEKMQTFPSPEKSASKKSEYITTLLIGAVVSYVSYKNMPFSIIICIMTAQNL